MSSLIFEDSGIDSEDKSTQKESKRSSALLPTKHMEELEVAFCTGTATKDEGGVVTSQPLVNSAASASPAQQRAQLPNTCRVLQRKLELKVERARRNYCQQQLQQQQHQNQNQHQQQQLQQEDEARKVSHAANLIPINRLSVPGGTILDAAGNDDVEHKPLVDYKSVSSDDEEDGEEISFFTAKLRNAHRQRKAELTDTFSIQEMTIDSELDSDDSDASQNLELLPPMMKLNLLDRLRSCFDCGANGNSSANATS